MKKRILSVLISGSLLFGTIFANATSISFEDISDESVTESSEATEDVDISFEELENVDETSDLEQSDKTSDTEEIETVSENNILEANESDSYIDEYYFPGATEENIVTLDNVMEILGSDEVSSPIQVYSISARALSGNMKAYFTEATAVRFYGNTGSETTSNSSSYGTYKYIQYNNTSVDEEKYIVFENAVCADNNNYDLIIYPFKVNTNAQILTNSSTYGMHPTLRVVANTSGTKYAGFMFKVSEHNNINKLINIDVMFGMSQINLNEFYILPSNFQEIYIGSNLNATTRTKAPLGIQYKGKSDGNASTSFSNNCAIGELNISTSGTTIYYGGPATRTYTSIISFDEIKDYIKENGYTIQFNANGGSGSVPTTIIKYGSDSSTIMGDIGSSVPTKSGYTFKGWSASSNGTSRIAYSSISGATTTSNSWSYATYCANTGGNSSNRTLTLYAVWEYVPVNYTHTLSYNANGGSNAPPSSTVTNTSSTYSMTVSSSVPTRTGYTFAGWNTNSSGTGTNYSAGGSVSVGANATVTLYAKWTPITYSITYNGNGNTGGSTASQTKAYDAAINLQNNGFTKTGYHFTGWNTASNGAGTSYSVGASYNSNANLALYAQWAINSSTLKVNPNGGTWNNSTVAQTFTQNYNTTKTIPIPTRTGYTFTTWTRSGTNGTMTSLTGSSTYTFGASNGTTDTLTAEWKVNNYTVTYIDVIDSKTGKELGRSTASKPYNSTVKGSDKGSSSTDNAYYNGYYYVSDTSATVTTSGATVYRIFKQRMNTIAGNIIWEDWNNKNLSRPENVNLYISGSDGKTYSYVITGDYSQNTPVNRWPYSYDLPKYDGNGNVIVYTVSQDRAISQEKGLSYQEPLINGYDITNKITNRIINTEDYFQIPVTIIWDDENDSYGFRPETATIHLLQNGEVIKAADVSDSYTFTELLKYDENGDKYVYTIQASDEKRYTKVENNSAPYNKTVTYTFVNSYFSVLIPKVIVLDGIGGNANYDITVNGAFYYNDTLTVKSATSFVMTDRNNISSMKANILQSKQNFMKEDITSSGAKTTGSIQVDRANFAGSWTGTFNFDIKFVMQN